MAKHYDVTDPADGEKRCWCEVGDGTPPSADDQADRATNAVLSEPVVFDMGERYNAYMANEEPGGPFDE